MVGHPLDVQRVHLPGEPLDVRLDQLQLFLQFVRADALAPGRRPETYHRGSWR
jgi:hypothetical protein